MTSPKKDTRRGRFHLWTQAKAVVSDTPKISPTDSGTSEIPGSDSSLSARRRVRVRLSRSGSRILLFLGLRGSKSNKESSADTDGINSVQTGAESLEPSSPAPDDNGNDSPGYPTAESPQSEPLPDTPSYNAPIESVEILSEPLPVLQSLPESQGESSIDDHPPPATELASSPSSKFVDRFSHKISLAFGQPTVIRRTNLRPRASILRANPHVLDDLSRQGDCANDSSDPSTSPSSFGSPLIDGLTPMTSMTTGVSLNSSEKSKLWNGHEQWTQVTHWSPLPEDESPESSFPEAETQSTLVPSIKTVEAASVAKVYLELYFNSVFQSQDSREQRQLELEQQIYSFELTPEERLMTRHNWRLRENDYLRQSRVLRANRYCTQSEETVSVAGYKPIKVLGKGSFGVVRLVRKSDIDSKGAPDDSSPNANGNNAGARSNALEILRSAVEGAKQTRRRYMTGERKEFYAMKVIKKAEMIRNSQEGHIRAERDFLVASESSRWVVPLIASFQDINNLYLVMDYMVGGDFLGLLIRKDTLREDWARFYLAEMILCIEEAHRLFWIHRDVKPDNFLISASGHLKISDFGLAFNGHWSHDQSYYNNHRYSLVEKLGIDVKGDAEDQKEAAKQKELASDIDEPSLDDPSTQQPPSTELLDWRDNKGRRRFAKSVVGTSQYMAPEVIRGEMYDGRCDWWSLGIILYECLYGFTPFACENRHDTKIKIIHHGRTLQFPREKSTDKMVSAEAIDLITRFLQEREYRICSPKYRSNDILSGRPVSTQMLYSMDTQYRNIASYHVYANDATDIKIHSFFRGIRWQDLHLCQPPMIPRVKNWEDTRYFDEWKLLDNGADPAASISKGSAHLLGRQPGDAAPGTGTPNAAENPTIKTQPVETATDAAPDHADVSEKKKEKKRPRDKILRDKQMSKTALEIRKNSVFLGYTYRRPDDVALAFRTERGRQRFARGDLAGLYAA